MGFNGLNALNAVGKTASIEVSPSHGSTYGGQIVLDRVGDSAGQDAPSVRQAVNGCTVYAAFTQWNGVVDDDGNGARFEPASGFRQIGQWRSGWLYGPGGGNDVTGASPTGYFTNAANTP